MKSMTKLMVVAMVLAAALVVTPVAAGRVIGPSDTNIYVGEEEVNFGANFPTAVRLVHYTDRTAEATDKIFTLVGGNVTEFTKGIPTGTYYLENGTTGTPVERTLASFNVQNPEATLDVVLDNSRKDSVNGKSVTRDTVLAFKLGNNVDNTVNAGINIDLTLPGGGVTNNFSNVNLQRTATGATEYVGPLSLSSAEAGTYTAVAKWARATDFYGKGFDSSAVTFEVASKSLALTSNKDSLVRGNSFTVTITGESNTVYYLYVKDAGNVNYPWMIQQNGVNFTTNAPVNVPADAKANVTTNAAGTRSVQFNTNQSTKDQSFTIRVEKPGDSGTYDEVKVKVEAGSVTITSSGTGTYYIGEEITLSGTNTEGETVYLFMTGPNLASRGVNLEDPSKRVLTVATGNGNFTTANVEADDTWSKKWNTAGLPLDVGSYTIYAVSASKDKDDLSQAKYSTASISLRSGFLTATTSSATVAKGDKLTISGIAQGNPDNVLIWIFGKNFYGQPNSRDLHAESVPVESDGTFEYELESGDTKDLAGGQYFVVVQHPMGAGSGSIGFDANGTIWGDGITTVKLTSLQAPAAATALIDALDSPNIPDTYVKLTFVVEEPQLFIDPIGDKTAGSKFTISGTTNLAAGNTLNIDVTSAAFQPGQKTEGSAFSGTGGSTVVQKGDGMNTWSFEVDGTSFKVDQYIVTVESIEAGKTATALFNVIEGQPTTQPTGTVTATPTGTETTPTTTTTTQATPTTTPGFGALLALAGLGAVAFLVLRRD